MAAVTPAVIDRLVVSPSLLKSVSIHPISNRYSLGMEEFTESYLKSLEENSRTDSGEQTITDLDSDSTSLRLPIKLCTRSCEPHPQVLEPPPKKQKVRFQTLSNEELGSLCKPNIPRNTQTSTKWALDNFHAWLSHRNSNAECEADKCPETLLEDMDSTQLNKWLAVYIAETKKVNGDSYPPSTLQSLLSGLLRHMRSIDDTRAPNIFAKNDPSFRELHCTMDSLYRKLRSEGVGAEKHSADPFTIDDENKLWSLGVMGTGSPVSLLRAVFYYNGKNFCLRGGDEHWNLKLSQFRRTEKGYIYTENSSKNHQGGISQLTLKNKCVEIVENKEAGDHCHCKLLDAYISKLPEEAKTKDLFYVRPLEEVKPDSTKPWYYCAPIGRNKLSKMVSEMCKLASIPGHHTNHSLRATGATQLYTAGVPEKIIQERTGHRSVECLRSYERTSDKQQHAVSRILSSSTELNFQTEMKKLEMHESHSFSKTCPAMTFSNCQVNINYNQGPSAPTYFGSQ